MMKMEGQKMCSCLIWDYKFLKVYYYQWETSQCFCMIARQLIWVKKGWDSCKFADSRGTQISPEPLKIHVLYTEKFVYFRVSVRKSETLLRENRYQVWCHILTVLFYVEYCVFMAYHPKPNHSSHCHHSFHIDHIFSPYMFLPGPATKQNERV